MWILCKDKLPNKDGRYLVTAIHNYSKHINYVHICNFANKLSDIDDYEFEGEDRPGFFNYDSEYGYIEKQGVIAWQELPEPYEGVYENE